MYRIEDYTSAIKEIQRLLNINITGIYDSKTRDAVVKVQDANSILADGVTNYETFVNIVKEYNDRQSKVWQKKLLFNPEFPYKVGDIGEDAGRINEAISEILKEYQYENFLPKGKYIGAETINGVKFLQEIFRLPSSDIIDEIFMNRIVAELEAIAIKRNTGL